MHILWHWRTLSIVAKLTLSMLSTLTLSAKTQEVPDVSEWLLSLMVLFSHTTHTMRAFLNMDCKCCIQLDVHRVSNKQFLYKCLIIMNCLANPSKSKSLRLKTAEMKKRTPKTEVWKAFVLDYKTDVAWPWFFHFYATLGKADILAWTNWWENKWSTFWRCKEPFTLARQCGCRDQV